MKIAAVRNTILDDSYQQAVRPAGRASIEALFKTQRASEVEAVTKVTDHLRQQIDHATSLPLSPERVR